MQFHRCKCGESTVWESGFPPQPCDVCQEYGSTFSYGPGSHQEPLPHDYEWRFDELSGKRSSVVCQRCHDSYHPDAEDCGGDASRFNYRDLKPVPATA